MLYSGSECCILRACVEHLWHSGTDMFSWNVVFWNQVVNCGIGYCILGTELCILGVCVVFLECMLYSWSDCCVMGVCVVFFNWLN